jgi:hypothetical protein
MNRFFTKQQVIAEYNLPVHLQAELFRAVQPVEHAEQAEPLYLEAHLDRWLVGDDPDEDPTRMTARAEEAVRDEQTIR